MLDLQGQTCPSVHDGRVIIDNGKQIIACLMKLRDELPVEEIAEAEWSVPELEAVFKEGLYVDFVQYPTDDRAAQALLLLGCIMIFTLARSWWCIPKKMALHQSQ